MELGVIGLGKMGSGLAKRLLKDGHSIVAFDLSLELVDSLAPFGATPAHSIENLVDKLAPPKIVWVMAPAGEGTEAIILHVARNLSAGDGIVDGGNSHFLDSMRRAKSLEAMGLFFLDVGTSGGIRGWEQGYSLMIGGHPGNFNQLEPIFKTLAPNPESGYGLVGPPGAGHFIKMVHNGIEYGIMQAFAEGFEIINAKSEFGFNLGNIAEIWSSGSVVRSWLLELITEILISNPDLSKISSAVEDSGETRWLVEESIKLGVPAPIISLSLLERLQSRTTNQFSHRLLSSWRNSFGGHSMSEPEDK